MSDDPQPATGERDGVGAATQFRRASRADAIELAKARFLAGDRVEMQVLADELNVSRTTLYRWVGEREQLYGEVFGELVDDWLALIEPQVKGKGVERFSTILRRFLEFAAESEPLTRFTQREPNLAMRLMMDPGGPITLHSNRALRRLLSDIDPNVEVRDEIGNGIGVVSRTLVWANIATGREPDIEGAVSLAETLLQASGLERID